MIDGLAVGSPISPPVANVLEKFEKGALATFEKEKRKYWRRYVDDVIAEVKVSVVNEMLMHLNSRHENIRFTMEVEEDGRLPMLDVILHR